MATPSSPRSGWRPGSRPGCGSSLLGHGDEAGVEPDAHLRRDLLQHPTRRGKPGAGEDAAGIPDRRIDPLDPRFEVGQHGQGRLETRGDLGMDLGLKPKVALAAMRNPAMPPSSPIR
ncbi:MAG: hypothetical protein U1E52_04410 [Geminicoccaceae bacterium]